MAPDPFELDPFAFEAETARQRLRRRVRAAGGIALIAIGLPLIPFPIPIGGIVTTSGAVVLVRNSRRARSALGSLLARHPQTGRKIRGLFARMRRRR